MASKPLRRKILVRLILDQTGQKLPFNVYTRMRLARLLPPPVILSVDHEADSSRGVATDTL